MRRRLSIRARVAAWCAGLAVATGVIGVVLTLAITDHGLRVEARRVPLDGNRSGCACRYHRHSSDVRSRPGRGGRSRVEIPSRRAPVEGPKE